MFHFKRPTADEIETQIAAAKTLDATSPRFLSFENKLEPVRARWFARDASASVLGYGKDVFDAAKLALEGWSAFDLGWVRVANSNARIACGELVAVEVHSIGLWSVNLSRILETVDTGTRFGFLYATTRMHVEQGEESFLLRLDAETSAVCYELQAVSRPQDACARLAYPVTRALQHSFARDSHRRMRKAMELAS